MRGILLALITCILVLPACNDEERLMEGGSSAKAIFKKTGCKPKNANVIRECELYKDSINNVRYLYGSKIYDDIECFWVSKFSEDGEYIWEVINNDADYATRADLPAVLSNGDFVAGNTLLDADGKTIKGVSPIILAEEDGEIKKEVKIFDGYRYSAIYPFEDFFFCSISRSEAEELGVKEWAVQIKNSGKVMTQSTRMNIPTGQATWPNDTTYVQMTSQRIEKGYLYKGQVWRYNVALPDYDKCEMDIKVKNNIVYATYELTMPGDETTKREYELSYVTGKEPVPVTGISLTLDELDLSIGDIYTLAATVTPKNASVQDVTWKSSDKSVAEVGDEGRVEAVGKGSCTITATTVDGNYKATCEVTVTGEGQIEGIHFQNPEVNIPVGTSIQLEVTTTPSTILNENLRWGTSSREVVSITQDGVITGNSPGTATITVLTKDGKYEATCKVTVGKEISDFISLEFNSTGVVIENGFVTGSVYCRLTNNSSVTIQVTKLQIIDTSDGKVLGEADKSKIGFLEPGDDFNLGGDNFKYIYCPLFKWEYKYDGKTYTVSDIYGKSSSSVSTFSTQNVQASQPAVGNSRKQIQISRKE